MSLSFSKNEIKSRAFIVYKFFLESIHNGRTTQYEISDTVINICGNMNKEVFNLLHVTLHDLNIFIDDEPLECTKKRLGTINNRLTQYAAKEALDYFWYILFGSKETPIEISLQQDAPSPLVRRRHLSPTRKLRHLLMDLSKNYPKLISVNLLFEALERKEALINRKSIIDLSFLLERLGYCIVPDIRYYAVNSASCRQVVVFPKRGAEMFMASDECKTLSLIIRLGIMIVCCTNQNLETLNGTAELKQLIISNQLLTNIEKDSLMAFLYWLLNSKTIFFGFTKILTDVNTPEKIAISHFLILIANADGLIDAGKIKGLEKSYEILGLPPKQVISDIHMVVASNKPITVSLRDSELAFSIPKSVNNELSSNTFILNEELIKKREKETRQVKAVLENVFVDQIDENNVTNYQAPEEEISENLLEKLNQAHQTLFRELLLQEVWQRSDFRAKCRNLGLMMDGAMEVLNEWAFEYADVLLLEDGEPIYINVDVAMEMMDVKEAN